MKKINKSIFILFFLGTTYSVAAEINLSGLVDPTRPPDAILNQTKKLSTNVQSLKLTATYISNQGRTAIINNQQVAVGDQIGEYTVTTIKPYTVELTSAQQKEVLKLVPNIKRRHH